VDGGTGRSVLKVFSLPLHERATSACVTAPPRSP
jgi:hypothetical protein